MTTQDFWHDLSRRNPLDLGYTILARWKMPERVWEGYITPLPPHSAHFRHVEIMRDGQKITMYGGLMSDSRQTLYIPPNAPMDQSRSPALWDVWTLDLVLEHLTALASRRTAE